MGRRWLDGLFRYRVTGFVVCAVICLPLLAGCGGGSDTGKGEPKTAKSEETKTAEAAKAAEDKAETPAGKAWAARVVDAYQGALTEAVALLDNAPPAAEALPKLNAIQAKYVDILVPFGRERESMGSAARAQAQSQLMVKMLGIERTETFKKFQKLAAETYGIAKMKTDEEKEFQKALVGVSNITQYARFELLKKQDPKEAERLGIR
jgi:hypothetical protein